ncbi:hypothetical protein HDU91_000465 [Kappamyces sp. JEL0680]|nr:hypothetical protein HDU91_000465 [Kappamyces sp. JEL0680]
MSVTELQTHYPVECQGAVDFISARANPSCSNSTLCSAGQSAANYGYSVTTCSNPSVSPTSFQSLFANASYATLQTYSDSSCTTLANWTLTTVNKCLPFNADLVASSGGSYSYIYINTDGSISYYTSSSSTCYTLTLLGSFASNGCIRRSNDLPGYFKVSTVQYNQGTTNTSNPAYSNFDAASTISPYAIALCVFLILSLLCLISSLCTFRFSRDEDDYDAKRFLQDLESNARFVNIYVQMTPSGPIVSKLEK